MTAPFFFLFWPWILKPNSFLRNFRYKYILLSHNDETLKRPLTQTCSYHTVQACSSSRAIITRHKDVHTPLHKFISCFTQIMRSNMGVFINIKILSDSELIGQTLQVYQDLLQKETVTSFNALTFGNLTFLLFVIFVSICCVRDSQCHTIMWSSVRMADQLTVCMRITM